VGTAFFRSLGCLCLGCNLTRAGIMLDRRTDDNTIENEVSKLRLVGVVPSSCPPHEISRMERIFINA